MGVLLQVFRFLYAKAAMGRVDAALAVQQPPFARLHHSTSQASAAGYWKSRFSGKRVL